MKRRSMLLAMIGLATLASRDGAAAEPLNSSRVELLMFEEVGCPWCRRWRAEVGPSYPLSSEGKRAPLRVLDMHRPLPPGLVLAGPIIASPTFVLIEDGDEVGRIVGYPGSDFFWGLLEGLMRKVKHPTPNNVVQ